MTRNVFNGGQWTESRFHSFVKSALRAASRKWPPKYGVLNASCVGPQLNPKSGRMAKHYKCANCADIFPASKVQVDHINPIIDPLTGFTNWDDVINKMFCESDNLQTLCLDCHKAKTAAERKQSKGK